MNVPKVTTIIPSYNHAQYIEQAMQSVLDQDYSNIELIVVDDGSTDDSHEVIRNFCDKHNNVIAILNGENRGQSAVLNQGLAKASGDFVQFLPSDDWYLPEKSALQVERFLSGDQELGVVYGRGYRYFEKTGDLVEWNAPKLYRGKVLRQLIEKGNFIYPATPMFRKECFEKEPFDETYRAEGESIFTRIARHFSFDFVENYVVVMRDHEYNIGKDAEIMYFEVSQYLDRIFSNPDLPEELKALEPKVRARHHRTKALQLIRNRSNLTLGRESLREAIRYKPALIFDPKVIAAFLLSYIWKDK